MTEKANEPRVMKFRCIECRLIHYDAGQKDGITCECGGKLDPLGWVGAGWIGHEGPYTGIEPETKGRVKTMLRVQTTVSMGEGYIERVLEVEDISTLSEEERAAIIDGAISPVSYDQVDTGPDVCLHDWEKAEPQGDTSSAVGDIKVKLDMDTSGIDAALEGVRELLTRPLSDFISVQVGEDIDKQA